MCVEQVTHINKILQKTVTISGGMRSFRVTLHGIDGLARMNEGIHFALRAAHGDMEIPMNLRSLDLLLVPRVAPKLLGPER